MYVFAGLTILAICSFTSAAAQERKLLWCGHVLDLYTGLWRDAATIIVEDDKIYGINDGFVDANSNEEVIDLRRHYVLPGLIDMHVHLEAEPQLEDSQIKRSQTKYQKHPGYVSLKASNHAKDTLLAGFTTVRDVGGTGINIALRNAINDGIAAGPRIITSGRVLKITGAYEDVADDIKLSEDDQAPGMNTGYCNGKEACREAVRYQVGTGADLIKIAASGPLLSENARSLGPTFTDEELETIVETARDLGVHVAAHAHDKSAIIRAIQAGVTTIEHCTFMDREVYEQMIARGTFCVPTISVGWTLFKFGKRQLLPSKFMLKEAVKIGPYIQNAFFDAFRAGVRISFGTDAGVFPHGDNAKEFRYMVNGGMLPIEAIRSATLVNAQLLDMEKDIGSIEPNKQADIIAVNGDVLKNIDSMQNVKFVMKAGVVHKSDIF